MYYHEDLTPLSYEECVELYRQLGETDPSGRADLYLGFAEPSRIELLVFRDRFSAVVWLHQYAVPKVGDALADYQESSSLGEFAVEGWE